MILTRFLLLPGVSPETTPPDRHHDHINNPDVATIFFFPSYDLDRKITRVRHNDMCGSHVRWISEKMLPARVEAGDFVVLDHSTLGCLSYEVVKTIWLMRIGGERLVMVAYVIPVSNESLR